MRLRVTQMVGDEYQVGVWNYTLPDGDGVPLEFRPVVASYFQKDTVLMICWFATR